MIAEIILIIVVAILPLAAIFLVLKQLKAEFSQNFQTMFQNISSLIQLMTNQTNNTASQLNQRFDNTISILSSQLNQMLNQVMTQVGQTTGQVNQRLDSAAKVISELTRQIGAMKEEANQIKNIGQSIAKLEDLLKAQKFRGGIGEITLENLIKEVLPGNFYEFQYPFKDGKKVDAVIKFPNENLILPIDSKFPFDNYVKMKEAKDENERRKIRQDFIKDVKKRAEEVKNYIRPNENTLDFALMYIPFESVYYEIIADESGDKIWEDMFAIKVIPVSPSIFYALLITFMRGVKVIQLERSKRQVIDLLSKLTNEFTSILEDFKTLGNHIKNAQSKYQEIDNKLQRFEDSFSQILKEPPLQS